MLNVDDHMDELFQKAAENYPLKIKPGNFDDLIPFVAGETASTVTPSALKGKRKTALLLLVFLITGGIITIYLVKNNGRNLTATEKVQVEDIKPVKRNIINDQEINTAKPVISNTTVKTDNEPVFEKNKTGSFTKAKLLVTISQGLLATDDDAAFNDNSATAQITITKSGSVNSNANSAGINKNIKDEKTEPTDKAEEKKDLVKEETKPVEKNDKKAKNNKPLIYFGATVGTELNQVKNQGNTKPGFNGGLLLGLQLNKKLSVETGIQLSQKKYYSEGKYFHPKDGSMPSNMKIMSLDGSCTVIEIPVSIKYNFSKKNNSFYGKAGVSSYIVTKETNKYNAIVSGQAQEINSTYRNGNGYAAAELRIGAGYERGLTKKLNIRIEPYVQIPLKGIGIGALPVTSTGLQLVLTRD